MSAPLSTTDDGTLNEGSDLYHNLRHIYKATPIATAVDEVSLPSTTYDASIPADSPIAKRTGSSNDSLRFRLLEVQKELSTSGNVVCVLKQASLDTCGHYYALSYTWGHSQTSETVIINGVEVLVSCNLEAFLRRARKNLYNLPLWVDAVCIDQSSITERNHQVGVMGQIYSRARKVLVWLGYGNESFAYLLNRLNLLQELHESLDDAEVSSFLGIIEDFLRLPYWSRAWIVQELLLARSIEMIYDEESIEWLVFWKVVDYILDKYLRYGSMHYPGLSSNIESTFGYEHHKQRLTINMGQDLTLAEAMLKYGSAVCVDIRDRIFAMLSLVTEGFLFKPDYAWTPAQVVLHTYSHFGGDLAQLRRLEQILEVPKYDILCATPRGRFVFHFDKLSTFLYRSIDGQHFADDPSNSKESFKEQVLTHFICKACYSELQLDTAFYTPVFEVCVVENRFHIVCVRGQWNGDELWNVRAQWANQNGWNFFLQSERDMAMEWNEAIESRFPPYMFLLVGPTGTTIDRMEVFSAFHFQAEISSALQIADKQFERFGKSTSLPWEFVVRLSEGSAEMQKFTYALEKILRQVREYCETSAQAFPDVNNREATEALQGLFTSISSLNYLGTKEMETFRRIRMKHQGSLT